MTSFRPVIALSRGLEVLRAINQERQSTVGSLHKATGLNKATIVRMLETLEHEGYVVRRTEPASYAPTGRALLLSAGYDEPTWIGGIAEPILNKFRKQIHWPSDIAVLDQSFHGHRPHDARGWIAAVQPPAGFSLSRPRHLDGTRLISPSASPPSRSALPRGLPSVPSPGTIWPAIPTSSPRRCARSAKPGSR